MIRGLSAVVDGQRDHRRRQEPEVVGVTAEAHRSGTDHQADDAERSPRQAPVPEGAHEPLDQIVGVDEERSHREERHGEKEHAFRVEVRPDLLAPGAAGDRPDEQ